MALRLAGRYNPALLMALASGTKLGPYETQALLGAGGMGEVYRARDTRLGREVAIKVLAQHLSAQTELKERFDREARAISSSNHPRICTWPAATENHGNAFPWRSRLAAMCSGLK
jgi:eukaryotic-like serine/threonine-protein kinase